MSDDLRAGLRVSAISIAWTTVTSAVAIGLGLTTPSLVLIAFGVTGLLDAAGSIALVAHFRHTLRHEVVSERHEQIALRIVSVGLIVTGAATGAESVRRLLTHHAGESSAAGAVIAAASVVVLGALAHRKRVIAERVSSDALLADSHLSATGALLAVVTVAGAALTVAWWLDAAAALVIGVAAATLGVRSLRTRGPTTGL
jgi:divalent metal cation (Fe/Co/Zn/Cd) transporter